MCYDMIKVYSRENCSNCNELKWILTNKGIEFEEVQNEKELMIVGSKSRIMSAPILEINEKYYSFQDFKNFLDILK